MKKYLFIGGPLDKQYEEASGNHEEVAYEPPSFTLYETIEMTTLGTHHSYILRLITLGITDLPVYALASMSDAEVLRRILTAYHKST